MFCRLSKFGDGLLLCYMLVLMLDISGYELSPWPASGWGYKLYTGDLVNVGLGSRVLPVWWMATDLNREFSLSAPFFSILLSPYADYAQISFEKVSHWLGSWPNGAVVPAGLCIDHGLYMCLRYHEITLYNCWATLSNNQSNSQIPSKQAPYVSWKNIRHIFLVS
jgi:hypothetical protein